MRISGGGNYDVSELQVKGNANQCLITVSGREAKLNFYFNNDGSTTIQSTGSNTDIANEIKLVLEQSVGYSAAVDQQTSTFKGLSEEFVDSLIDYLKGNEKIECNDCDLDDMKCSHKKYIFKSTIGDKLVINRYGNGTIVLQGKPAYIYSETLAYLAYEPNISRSDLIDSISNQHKVKIETKTVDSKLKEELGEAYDSVDPVIIKLLSTAVAFRKVDIELADYSCMAFPALRALEGQLKNMLAKKEIYINEKETFGKAFNSDKLYEQKRSDINDDNYSDTLEEMYVYFKDNRHSVFHVNYVLAGTKMIEKREEADEIVSDIISLIKKSAVLVA